MNVLSNREIIEKYDRDDHTSDVIFMNDGLADLDQYGYPIIDPIVKFNHRNHAWRYQANMYYRSLVLGGIQSGDRFLDLSCGRGGGINFVQDNFKFNSYVGLDLNPKHIEFAKSYLTNAQLITASATQTGLPPDSIDVITCIESCGYYNTYNDYIREAHRILKPRGRLIEASPYVTEFSDIIHDKFRIVAFKNITRGVRVSCAVTKYIYREHNSTVYQALLNDESRYINNSSLYNIVVLEKHGN